MLLLYGQNQRVWAYVYFRHMFYFIYFFSQKIGFGISCKLQTGAITHLILCLHIFSYPRAFRRKSADIVIPPVCPSGRPSIHPSQHLGFCGGGGGDVVGGGQFVTTLCFIPLRYIINLWVRELIALKILWKFTVGRSP